MNVVFMGTPEFAKPSLKALIDSNHQICAVFTKADMPKNRGMKLTMPPVKMLALEHNIPVYQPKSLKDDGIFELLKNLAPDIIVVAAYGLMLPKAVLELPRYGCINVHASLLPKYRGASPINAAIIEGENESGITIMQMNRGIDTGDILAFRSIEIGKRDTFGILHDRLAEIGGGLLIEVLEQIEQGTVKSIKQQDELSSYAHMIKPNDTFVSFMGRAEAVSNKIRGFDPIPGAYGFLGEEKLKLFSGEFNDYNCENKPGEIIKCDKKGLLVQATGGTVLIKEVQLSGKKRMAADDCFRGRSGLLDETFK
ncbi:MAG: methionyl-tRNA formyltransferase [Clostridiaceae bacterium]|nr:methionyl-tRNA formyltransferase [Clostridiaceae bacterium]